MSRPEPSDNVSDYAPRGAGDFYRHGRAGGALGEGPKGDLSRLRQSLGPEPEVVHVPQPTRRIGWFASGFAIALVVGVVAGWLVISQFPSVSGKGSGSGTKTAELTPAKSPEEANAPGAGIANTAPRAIQSSAPSAGVPAAPAPAQPASSAPARVATAEPAPAVRGVTDTEVRFGISAPFSGPAKELGQNMKLGIEAAFSAANANGGVFGRKLRLVAADDGYEPARTAGTMAELYDKDQVFGLVGNVGTPTAVVALPYALDRKMLFFGAFTGAGLLRSDPPDRYVFNYRASYAEETAAVVNYLVKVKRLAPEQAAVFAQQDAPDYVSLEGYVDATVLIAALKQNGAQLDTEKLVATFENIRDLDIGLGTTMNYSRSEHQGVHKVWGTQLDADGRYQPFDLQ